MALVKPLQFHQCHKERKMDFVTLTLAKKYTDKTMKDGIPSEAIEDAVEKYLTENPPAGGSTLKQAAVITTTENVDSIEVEGLNLKLPITLLLENAGSVTGDGLNIIINGNQIAGFTGTSEKFEAWLYDDGEKMLGYARMGNGGRNNYEWNDIPEVIETIAITSHYHRDEAKYYSAGTTLTIYEGVFPRVH
jgi:hypothetical protein